MPGKIYLILCGILSQGICGTFGDKNISESSISLVRQKRVISYKQGEDRIALIKDHPYIVHIKQNNRINCVGTILSHRVIITSAECVREDKTKYRIVSNSAISNSGISHNVTEIKLHSDRFPGRTSDGIALLIIYPLIVYNAFARKIDLHVGPILPDMLGTVSGWGFNYRNNALGRGTDFPLHLRSIQVPILSHRDCVNRYRPYITITDKLVCTFHGLKRTGHTDGGAPLVIDNLLAGIFLYRGPGASAIYFEYPDVFALLQHSDYGTWIRANI